MECYAIYFDNYEDETYVEYFSNYLIAEANFEKLCNLHRNYDEFEWDNENDTCSWFDPRWNEYSTHIRIEKVKIKINKTIIY